MAVSWRDPIHALVFLNAGFWSSQQSASALSPPPNWATLAAVTSAFVATVTLGYMVRPSMQAINAIQLSHHTTGNPMLTDHTYLSAD